MDLRREEPSARRDPPAYLEQLAAYLEPLKETTFFDGCWLSYTDVERFVFSIAYLDRFHALRGAAVLDLGCGTGGLLLACLRHGAARLVGVEVDPEVHRLGRLRLGGTPIETVLTDGTSDPPYAGTFDAVFSMHVIEHTTSAAEHLRQIHRSLRPGGVALVSCPNRLWPIEPHGGVPFVPWLPISIARRLCLRVARSRWSPEDVRQQFRTAALQNAFLSFFRIRRLCRESGLELVAINDPARFFALESIELGALGRRHPRLSSLVNLSNRLLIRRGLAPIVRRCPSWRIARWLSLCVKWEIEVVIRRPA